MMMPREPSRDGVREVDAKKVKRAGTLDGLKERDPERRTDKGRGGGRRGGETWEWNCLALVACVGN